MLMKVKILRGVGTEESFWQTFETNLPPTATVASVLEELNDRSPLLDSEGKAAEPIVWQCACLEKKCGACAMVIGGKPRLACTCKLQEAEKNGTVTLEPLSKFPRVADLQVDRSRMFALLEEMQLWLENDAELTEEARRSLHYKASSCLMCGLCMEVCPNCAPSNSFGGAMAALATYRAIDQEEKGAHRKAMKRAYQKHFFNDCAKSLSCQDVCPMKIPVEDLLVKTNAAAIWRR